MLSGCTNPLQGRETSFAKLPKSINLCYLKRQIIIKRLLFPNSVPQCKCKNHHCCEVSNTPVSLHPHSSYTQQQKMRIFNSEEVKKGFLKCEWGESAIWVNVTVYSANWGMLWLPSWCSVHFRIQMKFCLFNWISARLSSFHCWRYGFPLISCL